MDEAIRLLDQGSAHPKILEQAIHTLWRVSVTRNELRPGILERLVGYRNGVMDRKLELPARSALRYLEEYFGDLGLER